MTREAPLVKQKFGLAPSGRGWFSVNLADAAWHASAEYGTWAGLEAQERDEQLGVNVHVLQPGQPACKYHAESQTEAFLVLHGEATLIVEGEERSLKRWDYVHCPPGVHHLFVGAGDGPCAILMIGTRAEGSTLRYPVEPLAARVGGSSAVDTDDPKVAYAGRGPIEEVPSPWPLG
jgi:uncharacterized cupin superfamily protein